MARLEGAYEQINERLSELRGDVQSLHSAIRGLGETLRTEIGAGETTLRAEITAGDTSLRRQMSAQFYWTLTLILGSILIPILRDLGR